MIADPLERVYHRGVTADPTKLSIVHYPDPVLRETTVTVDPEDATVRAVAERMLALMHDAEGVGLAAPQVGLAWRLFVTNAGTADPVDRVYFNPELTLDADAPKESAEEGCLSLPGIHVQRSRPIRATIRATGLDGEPFEFSDDGFLARVWQHEFDHLEGVLIIDKMTPMERMNTRRTLKGLRLAFAENA